MLSSATVISFIKSKGLLKEYSGMISTYSMATILVAFFYNFYRQVYRHVYQYGENNTKIVNPKFTFSLVKVKGQSLCWQKIHVQSKVFVNYVLNLLSFQTGNYLTYNKVICYQCSTVLAQTRTGQSVQMWIKLQF